MPDRDQIQERVEWSVRDVDPDVIAALVAVSRRGRRRRLLHGTAKVAAVIGLLALMGFAVPWIRDIAQTPRPAQQPSPTAPDVLDGTYRTRIAPVPGVVNQLDMAGTWVMTPAADGSLGLSGPSGFTGDLSGMSFRLTHGEFQTTAFANDLCTMPRAGTYRWALSQGELRFTVIDDPCDVRVALFAGHGWIEQGS